jgi:hypothetical protein
MIIQLRIRATMLAVALLLAAIAPTALLAQQKEPSDGAKGRLPAYFKDIVSDQQKDSIYKIQTQFDEKLKTLEARFKELSTEIKTVRDEIDAIRDQERSAVEAVLTQQQVAKIKRLQAEAQAKLAQELLKAAEEAAKRAQALAEPE